LTLPGTVLATPSFAAPEVLEGGAPTPASDVFSLAALIYGLISGRPAFADTNRADPPPPLSDPAVDRVLRPALAAEPGRRPSAQELAAGLRGGAPTTGITTVPTSVAPPTAFGGSTEVLEAIDSPPPLPPTAPTPNLVKPRRSSKLVWVGFGLVFLLSAVLVPPLLLDDESARAVSASTVTPLPVTTASPVTTSTAPATTVPPTTLVDDLTQARSQLASVLASVGPPELKPKEEDEILKKVEQAVSKSFDKPEEAAKELREAANLISKELDGDSEREALAAIDGIAAALGLELSDEEDD
ncbi:MAG TPA: hypothetical protein VJQ57_07175, partial [Acidimicrobiia bacterium]|nr:hypothetical protein [Acidimicrobiia bacterium]